MTWFWMNIDFPFFPGSYNALSMANVRFFKPNPRTLVQLPDRLQGWRIRTGSYFLIPYKQASRSYFPQDWTIFLSFKADSFSQVGNKSKLRRFQLTIPKFYDILFWFLGKYLHPYWSSRKRRKSIPEYCWRSKVCSIDWWIDIIILYFKNPTIAFMVRLNFKPRANNVEFQFFNLTFLIWSSNEVFYLEESWISMKVTFIWRSYIGPRTTQGMSVQLNYFPPIAFLKIFDSGILLCSKLFWSVYTTVTNKHGRSTLGPYLRS